MTEHIVLWRVSNSKKRSRFNSAVGETRAKKEAHAATLRMRCSSMLPGVQLEKAFSLYTKQFQPTSDITVYKPANVVICFANRLQSYYFHQHKKIQF